MIAMRVGDEYMRHAFSAHGIEQRTDVRGIIRAGIDDCHLIAPEDVAHGSFERERTRVIGHDPPQARHRFIHHAGREFEILVEGDIFAHASSGGTGNRPTTISGKLAPWEAADDQCSARIDTSAQAAVAAYRIMTAHGVKETPARQAPCRLSNASAPPERRWFPGENR